MYCSKCGNFESDGVINCTKCNNPMLMKPSVSPSFSQSDIQTTGTDRVLAKGTGKQIIALAMTIRVLLILIAVIAAGAAYAYTEEPIAFFLVLIVGVFFAWLSTLVLCGFGELVNNSEIIAKRNS